MLQKDVAANPRAPDKSTKGAQSDGVPPAPPAKAYKFPKNFGACADRLSDIRELRLKMQREVDAVEAEEKALKEYIIANLPKSEGGAIGKHHKVQVVTKIVPSLKDWDAFCRFVSRTKSYDLFQRRLNEKAVAERWEAKKEVPGVEQFQAVTLSLTKI